MKALRAHERGGPDVLVLDDVPDPAPAAGQVLVAVRAAAITYDELVWDVSWVTADGRSRLPITPSHEFSGVVVERGEGVTSLELGAEVYGLVPLARDGSAAELVAIEAALVARRPRQSSWIEAAAISLAGPTAWQALHDRACVVAGERVLVLGGAGGVGSIVVQLAVCLGADVSATASACDLSLVRSLGASEVFDRATDRVSGALPFDVVVDATGATDGAASPGVADVVRLDTRVVHLVASRDDPSSAPFVVRPSQDQLTRIAGLVDEGVLRPLVAATYPLASGRDAYASRDEEHPPGKTVLVVR